MTTEIKDLFPRTTTGSIPVSEDYLNDFAERIILECVRVADGIDSNSGVGDSIIENFGLR